MNITCKARLDQFVSASGMDKKQPALLELVWEQCCRLCFYVLLWSSSYVSRVTVLQRCWHPLCNVHAHLFFFFCFSPWMEGSEWHRSMIDSGVDHVVITHIITNIDPLVPRCRRNHAAHMCSSAPVEELELSTWLVSTSNASACTYLLVHDHQDKW